MSSVLKNGFQPGGDVNGNSSRGWGKTHDTNGNNDPTICWDPNGNSGPLGLQDMTAEEEEVSFTKTPSHISPALKIGLPCAIADQGSLVSQAFSTDVNSPLKQPQQQSQQPRDGGQALTMNGRKQSMTQGLSSPSGGPRPGARRRETTDTNPFSGTIISPTSAGPRAQEPWFGIRRNIETKEPDTMDESKQQPAAQETPAKPTGFPGLTRNNTSSGATGFPVSSAWSAATTTPTASAFSAFGSFALNSPGLPEKSYASGTSGSRFFSSKPENDHAAASTTPNAEAYPSWRPRPRTGTDAFGDGDAQGPSGSAALGGARDTSPPPMPTTHGSQIFETPAKANASDFGMSGLNLGGSRVASPSQTNPYRSPPDRGDNDQDVNIGFDRSHGVGGHSEQNFNFSSMRGFPAALEGSDRSQTSSVALGAKSFAPLSNLGGWPATFTPDRERTGFGAHFGNSVFTPMNSEIQSPGLGTMGGGLFGPAGTGLGGGPSSKLASLFPTAMQAQMHPPEHDTLANSVPDTYRQPNPLSAGAIGAQSRDSDSPMSQSRAMLGLGGVFSQQPQANNPGVFTTTEHNHGLHATASQTHDFGASTQGQPFGTEPAAAPPQSQTRIMVMPDRMLWRYMDPQGIAQGPFSGIQMNEWYKNNHFTNDLRVRKEEDSEFEPLGQLIRRIGNSREPFLVPQVGIPHGHPPQPVFPVGGDGRGGGVMPPLLSVVPSYGKTLTAEEQNNLERRKQEEQLAQARQREYMAQPPHFRGIHPTVSGGLQHQASMHSLQSQPSYGSITSPIGMQPPGPTGGAVGGGAAGFFDGPALNRGPGMSNAMNAGMEHHRGDYNEHERHLLANIHVPNGVSGTFQPQPVGPPTTNHKSQLPAVDQLEMDPQVFKDRLKEFQEYQGIGNHRPDEEFRNGPSRAGLAQEQAEAASRYDTTHIQDRETVRQQILQQRPHQPQLHQQQQDLTLTEQVQKAQAANRQQDDPWARQASANGLPMPFPAPGPSSATHIAAPTAQRRTNLADQYIDTHDTHSQSDTPGSSPVDSPGAQPPPLAPWARDPGMESQKQPTKLRDIQEAEARQRAKQEADRRANQEQEALVAKEREKISSVVPGLPSNSTWGSGSPAPSAPSPWSKPVGVKVGAVGVVPSASGSTTPSKKTLAEIQKEEEARKRREVKDQVVQSGATAASIMGKRYAELASKVGPPGMNVNVAAAASGAAFGTTGWSTVGAGGKVKIPTGPQAQTRAVSATFRAPGPQGIQQQVKPVATMPNKSNTVPDAHLALRKWIQSKLVKDLNPTHKVEEVVNLITTIGSDTDVIVSILFEALERESLVSPNDLAVEYVRRRGDADKGIFEPPTEPKAAAGTGGWSEVAKKSSSGGQAKDDLMGSNFKVVRSKKAKK